MSRGAIRSVLVASDLTPESDAVVRGAATLARAAGAILHVVHGMEVLGRPLWEASTSMVRLQNLIHERHTRLYEQLQRALPDNVRTGSTKIEYRPPAESISIRARAVEADLIVVGGQRRSFASEYAFGRTVHRLLEESVAPCLVLREGVISASSRILLPVGATDMRKGLLAARGHWLLTLRDQLHRPDEKGRVDLNLLHVVKSPHEWRKLANGFARQMRMLMECPEFGKQFTVQKRIAWSRAPATEILRTASELDVDIIAMGVCRNGPLLRALLGGVSAEVLRHSTTSVLLFPPRLGERWGFEAVEPGKPELQVGNAHGDAQRESELVAAGTV